MSISVGARKLLWGKSGNQCAYPNCGQVLTPTMPVTSGSSSGTTIIAQEAHIHSHKINGPRYDANFPSANLDEEPNLILLCPTHHVLVDAHNGANFSVRDLTKMKADHEAYVIARMSSTVASRLSLEIAISVKIQSFEDYLFQDFSGLSLRLNQSISYISLTQFESLKDFNRQLLSSNWPVEYPKIAASAERVRLALSALLYQIANSFEESGPAMRIDRAYKRIDGWNPDLYFRLLNELRLALATVWFLVCELTRASNLFISAVQEELDNLYRFQEGLVLMEQGDEIRGTHLIRLEYDAIDWATIRDFPSLEEISQKILDEAAQSDVGIEDVDIYLIKVQ